MTVPSSAGLLRARGSRSRRVRFRGQTSRRRIGASQSVLVVLFLVLFAWFTVFVIWYLGTVMDGDEAATSSRTSTVNSNVRNRHHGHRLAGPKGSALVDISRRNTRGQVQKGSLDDARASGSPALPRAFPNAVLYDFRSSSVGRVNLHQFGRRMRLEKEDGDIYNRFFDRHGDDGNGRVAVDADRPQCVQMHEWMGETFPSCNRLHEISMGGADATDERSSLTPIAEGTVRMVWKFQDIDGSNRALKSHMWSSGFNEDEYEKNRHDSLVMERLTGSPYVPDIYAFCGTSQLVEFADKGTVHDLIKRMRQGRLQISSLVRLKVAYQIARAFADLASVGVAHNDVCCHQLVLIDDGSGDGGSYKLNDFHLSKFLKRDTQSEEEGKACKEPVPYCMQKIFSPEQYQAKANGGTVALDKSEVYNMGNIFYYLLTLDWIYPGVTDNDVRQRLIKGERSPYPERIKTTTDVAELALRDAVELCWNHDPIERPHSSVVADFLWKKIVDIDDEVANDASGGKHHHPLPPVLVKIPDIEPDYRNTDSDFWANLQV